MQWRCFEFDPTSGFLTSEGVDAASADWHAAEADAAAVFDRVDLVLVGMNVSGKAAKTASAVVPVTLCSE